MQELASRANGPPPFGFPPTSSIEVNRRQRRTKTDRLDARKLMTMLIQFLSGERPVWSVVRVPTLAEEDRRQVHRELLFARRESRPPRESRQGLVGQSGDSA
jgi:hypothetical protein